MVLSLKRLHDILVSVILIVKKCVNYETVIMKPIPDNKDRSHIFRYFVQTAAFILLFVLLFSIISGIFIRKTGNRHDLVRSFYREKPDSIDVLCLGSSHLYYSFQPNVLWNEYGITN